MRIFYDLIADELMVETQDGDVSLRDFYVDARKEAGITIGKLQRDSYVTHPRLYIIEHPKGPSNGKRSYKNILAALETLGYSITIE
jgi:hypothetical protein